MPLGDVKQHPLKEKIYKNRQLAIDDISDYIESFYNRTRRHQHLGGVSPDEFEEAAKRSKPGVH